MKKIIALIVLLVAAIVTACGTAQEETSGSGEKKTLVMGTSADYPPFEYIDTAKGDEIIGYDVDLAKMIGEELGYEIEVKDMDFNGLINALQTEQVDLVLAAMTPTPEREENVDFSDIYYTAKDMIISKAGSGIETPEDLEGKTVGVQLGSIQQDSVEGMQEKITLTMETRDRIPELIQDLINGRFDAIVIENIVADGYLAKNDELEGHTIEVEEEDAGSAIAFPKGSELTEEFNKVLQQLKEDGELEKLAEKWFDAK